MRISVDIPNDIAVRFFSGRADLENALLELAGFTAYSGGRISEYEFMRMLMFDSVFDVHGVMKRIQSEIDRRDAECLRQDSVEQVSR